MTNILGPLLTTCTREHDWRTPPPGVGGMLGPEVEPERLVDHAIRHGVAGCVHLSLRHLVTIDADLRALLEEAYFAGLEAHARCLRDLEIAAGALDAANLQWVVFKGPVLSEVVYSRPDLRSYSDLDLLVAPEDLATATATLEAAGGQLLDRNWHLALHRMAGELHVLMPTGTVVDLHWHVLNERSHRSSFAVGTDGLLRRAHHVQVGGVAVPTLDDEDTLVHLALHSCMSGGNRLLWCKDLEQAVSNRPPDWDALVARARLLQAGPPLAVMLSTASRALDFDVPETVIRRLSPGPLWRRLAALADRLAPVEGWTGGGSSARSVCRSTRRNDRTSGRALVRRFGSLVKSLGVGGPHETDRDPNSPGSVLAAGGDRSAFFDAVQGEARKKRRG